jgi:hypothetical protein
LNKTITIKIVSIYYSIVTNMKNLQNQDLNQIHKVLSYVKRYIEIDNLLDEQSLNDDVDAEMMNKYRQLGTKYLEKVKELFFTINDNAFLSKGFLIFSNKAKDTPYFEQAEKFLADKEGIVLVKPEYLPKGFNELTVLSNDQTLLDSLVKDVENVSPHLHIRHFMKEDVVKEFIYGNKVSFGSSVNNTISYSELKNLYDKDFYNEIVKSERSVFKEKESKKTKLSI